MWSSYPKIQVNSRSPTVTCDACALERGAVVYQISGHGEAGARTVQWLNAVNVGRTLSVGASRSPRLLSCTVWHRPHKPRPCRFELHQPKRHFALLSRPKLTAVQLDRASRPGRSRRDHLLQCLFQLGWQRTSGFG